MREQLAPDPLERALLQAARAERPTRASRRRGLAVLGLLYVAPVGAAANTSAAQGIPLFAKLAAPLVLGGAVAAGVLALDAPAKAPLELGAGDVRSSELAHDSSHLPQAELGPAQTRIQEGPPQTGSPEAGTNRPIPHQGPPRFAAKPTGGKSEPKPTSTPAPRRDEPPAFSSIRDEVRLLEAARAALGARRFEVARAHLAAYERQFPFGNLRTEATILTGRVAQHQRQIAP